MSIYTTLMDMLKQVARALGPQFRQQMTFVGGCTTGLLLTDDYARQQVRATDDVDLIVHVMGPGAFSELQAQLTRLGFEHAPLEDGPICAMKLGDLRVDFMPDDASLGFSNRWYRDATATATPAALDDELTIKLVTPVYFVATKLEAWNGRGKGDALESRDIEDILCLVDGRPELLEEIRSAPGDVSGYIAHEMEVLLSNPDFLYAVQSQARGDPERESLIFERLDILAGVVN